MLLYNVIHAYAIHALFYLAEDNLAAGGGLEAIYICSHEMKAHFRCIFRLKVNDSIIPLIIIFKQYSLCQIKFIKYYENQKIFCIITCTQVDSF